MVVMRKRKQVRRWFLFCYQLVFFCFEQFLKESVLSSLLIALENVRSPAIAEKFINSKASGSYLENLLKESLICRALFLYEVFIKKNLFKLVIFFFWLFNLCWSCLSSRSTDGFVFFQD